MDTLPHEKQIDDYIKTIDHLKKQNQDNPIFGAEIKKLDQKLEKLKQKIYSELSPWQRVQICRHRSRPHALDFFHHICDKFVELAGDRLFGDDHSTVGGLATINGVQWVVIGQEKGHDTESRVYRSFGMPSPEGYRKALRLMKLAEKFKLPVLTLIDTPGAYPCLEAEERGQGWAIAKNILEMSRLETPIISVIIGEGCSGGAIGIGVGDVVAILEHGYYSVISPEGCASILWKDSSQNVTAASALKIHAENLLEVGAIDAIIPEPLGGAHKNPEETYKNVKQFVTEQWHTLKTLPLPLLLEQRYVKFRQIGKFIENQ